MIIHPCQKSLAKVGSNNGSEEAEGCGGEEEAEEEDEEGLRIAVEETEGNRRLIGEQGGSRRGGEEGGIRGIETPKKLHLVGLSNSLEVSFLSQILLSCSRPQTNKPLGNVSSALQMEQNGDIAAERPKQGEGKSKRGRH